MSRFAQGRRTEILLGLLVTATAHLHAQPGAGQPGHGPWQREKVVETHQLKVGGATLQVDFTEGTLDLGRDEELRHIETAAKAVATYYGRFPVNHGRVLVVPMQSRGRDDVHGTTWGNMGGMPAFTRLGVSERMTAADLPGDWTTTHELVHWAFPSMPDEQHWIEEGLATYVEPLARVMTGELTARKVWGDMFRDMHQGEPQAGDQGIDQTHSWGRTYWGGALFCLAADVEIRKQTGNHKGLRDALRAIVDAGGTIDHDWELPKALAVGDKATGTHVLADMYAAWKDKPVTVDLPKLWSDLGVQSDGAGSVKFDDNAPLAKVREAIAH